MTSQWVLTDEDVRGLLAVFERQTLAEDGEIFYAEVLIRLRELIPCDDITFQLMDVSEQRVDTLFVTDDGVQRESSVGAEDEYLQVFWREFWEDGGCAGPLRTGDYTTVLRHSDCWAEREYANTPLGSMWVKLGLRHEVLVPLTPYGGTDRRLLLWRADGPDFTERELMMLRLVRPHVAELHARRDRELRGEPNLTPRQWGILRRVATGASNARIARDLGLSDATVRKHLENIYLRLHVLSRTEALARVRPFLDAA
ncbi:MAG TPA: LuxR C-terminal-related transcriptional regulator [Marmoricola sp.]|nr:LuxR C-terminal-related transcriptional regulator [Marmoricola sp.]